MRWKRSEAAAELQFFRRQPSLVAAIRCAARSITPSGQRHTHQRRRSKHTLADAERKLVATARQLRDSASFAELHEVVRSAIDPIKGIGPLTVYDIATRIGGHLRLEPDVVYLHAGTAIGAKALQLNGRDTLHPEMLPPAFGALRPREIEDCLCIYSNELRRLRSDNALQQIGARGARTGC
jgi:hypothetical protein